MVAGASVDMWLCRYGAALALGVACAGTGLKEAIALLETLSNDPVSYVRQGSLIASALVLVEQNDQTCPRVAHFRQLYTKVSLLHCYRRFMAIVQDSLH